jgi:hypothetical protein
VAQYLPRVRGVRMKTARDAIADLLEQALGECWVSSNGEKWSHKIKRRLLSAPEPVRLELAMALTNGISFEFPIESLIPGLLKQPENIRLELAALLNPWRPIETAPKDGEPILLYKPNERRSGDYITAGYWGEWVTSDIEQWIAVAGHPLREPTHWQPLPAPPSEDK